MIEDEANLVRRARTDTEAFAQLYERYVERIYAYIQRETGDLAVTEDIVATTFEKALKHLPTYRWRGTSFGAWLYKIARNELRMHWRRQKWTLPFLGRDPSHAHVEQTVQQQEQADDVKLALDKLSARDQELLRLRYYEDLSNAEIGEVLNRSPRTVAVQMHRALNRLRQQLARQAPEAVEVRFDVEL